MATEKYIWGCEYFSEVLEEINYRGNTGALWKQDFMGKFLEKHPDLRVVKDKKISYKDSANMDHMFLLEKTGF